MPSFLPQHFLYLSPLLQGHGSFRPIRFLKDLSRRIRKFKSSPPHEWRRPNGGYILMGALALLPVPPPSILHDLRLASRIPR